MKGITKTVHTTASKTEGERMKCIDCDNETMPVCVECLLKRIAEHMNESAGGSDV